MSTCTVAAVIILEHVSYPIDLRMLQQELHYLCMASSGCEVKRGAELAIEQVWIAVTFLQQQLCCLHFTVPGKEQTQAQPQLIIHKSNKKSKQFLDSSDPLGMREEHKTHQQA